MFLVVLLGLAATAAALPTPVPEAAKENEGVTIPVYKPWYNPYGVNIFGSNFLQADRKYGGYPNSMYTYKPYSPEYMFGLMNNRGMNKYDYMYRPYSHDYINRFNPYFNYPEYMKFDNTKRFNPYFNYPEYMKFKNIFRPSQSYANMMGYMHYPYYNYMNDYDNIYKPYSSQFNFKNDHQNREGYSYSYKPQFQGYPPNFVDMSYPNSNMNFKNNMQNPFYQNNDYMYKPYSPEYMYRFKQNANMRYPVYKYDFPDFPESIYEFMNKYMNKVYSFYNNLFNRENYGPFGFPDYFDVRSKRETPGVVEAQAREEQISQGPLTADLQPQTVDQLVARSKRDAVLTTDDVAVVPETELAGVGEISSDGPTDLQAQEYVAKLIYDIPELYYSRQYGPHYKTDPYNRGYIYQPWWNNNYYKK